LASDKVRVRPLASTSHLSFISVKYIDKSSCSRCIEKLKNDAVTGSFLA
jgi:hypothetical protein